MLPRPMPAVQSAMFKDSRPTPRGKSSSMWFDESMHSYMVPQHTMKPVTSPPSVAHETQQYWKSLPPERLPNHVRAYQTAAKAGDDLHRFRESVRHQGYQGHTLNMDNLLLDRPSVVNLPVNFDQGTALHIASMRGDAELAQLLIHRGVDTNASNHLHQTSLHAACESNRAGVVYELLSAGADADQRDAMRQTPLMRAAFTGAEEALVALLDYGANTRLRDEGRLTAIHKAATMGRSGCIQLLLERDPSAVNAEANECWTPLHLAAHGGHAEACELLLTMGGDPSANDAERMQPLHRAARAASESCCHVLVRGGADLLATDISRHTPLHTACEEGGVQAARALLEVGAPVTALDGMRRTPLHISAEAGHYELCALLMDFGADPMAADISKGVPSPLSVARRNRRPELVALFEACMRERASVEGAVSRPPSALSVSSLTGR